jgi:ABC-type taurine transport system substrate-binding protein
MHVVAVRKDFADANPRLPKALFSLYSQAKQAAYANRKELELVMRYTHEQGLAKHRLRVEEIFHPSTLELMEA